MSQVGFQTLVTCHRSKVIGESSSVVDILWRSHVIQSLVTRGFLQPKEIAVSCYRFSTFSLVQPASSWKVVEVYGISPSHKHPYMVKIMYSAGKQNL